MSTQPPILGGTENLSSTSHAKSTNTGQLSLLSSVGQRISVLLLMLSQQTQVSSAYYTRWHGIRTAAEGVRLCVTDGEGCMNAQCTTNRSVTHKLKNSLTVLLIRCGNASKYITMVN